MWTYSTHVQSYRSLSKISGIRGDSHKVIFMHVLAQARLTMSCIHLVTSVGGANMCNHTVTVQNVKM